MTRNRGYYLEKISWLRGVAILGVIVIHATSPMISYGYSRPNIFIDTAIIFNQWSRYCVPLFFVISGYLYGIKFFEHDFSYVDFIIRRFKKILIPYTIWVVVYLILRIFTGDLVIHQLKFIDIILLYLTGGMYGHLYFMAAIAQFYLSFPILMLVMEKVSTKVVGAIFWLGLLLLMTFVLQYRITVLPYWSSWLLFGKSYWFYWWFIFPLLGMQLGINLRKGLPLCGVNLKYFVIFYILFLCLMNYEMLSVYHGFSAKAKMSTIQDVEVVASFLKPYAFWYAIASCLILFKLIQHDTLIFHDFFSELGRYSFGIYLAHPLVNKCLLKAVKLIWMDFTMSWFGVVLLLFVGPGITYHLVKKISTIAGSEYIIGQT